MATPSRTDVSCAGSSATRTSTGTTRLFASASELYYRTFFISNLVTRHRNRVLRNRYLQLYFRAEHQHFQPSSPSSALSCSKTEDEALKRRADGFSKYNTFYTDLFEDGRSSADKNYILIPIAILLAVDDFNILLANSAVTPLNNRFHDVSSISTSVAGDHEDETSVLLATPPIRLCDTAAERNRLVLAQRHYRGRRLEAWTRYKKSDRQSSDVQAETNDVSMSSMIRKLLRDDLLLGYQLFTFGLRGPGTSGSATLVRGPTPTQKRKMSMKSLVDVNLLTGEVALLAEEGTKQQQEQQQQPCSGEDVDTEKDYENAFVADVRAKTQQLLRWNPGSSRDREDETQEIAQDVDEQTLQGKIARNRMKRKQHLLAQLNSSFLPLPYEPFPVPGGRFREVYYWDTYWNSLGLLEIGRGDVLENMVKNFAYLVNRFGYIPNGNRVYYLNRSQPPMFAECVLLWLRPKVKSENDMGRELQRNPLFLSTDDEVVLGGQVPGDGRGQGGGWLETYRLLLDKEYPNLDVARQNLNASDRTLFEDCLVPAIQKEYQYWMAFRSLSLSDDKNAPQEEHKQDEGEEDHGDHVSHPSLEGAAALSRTHRNGHAHLHGPRRVEVPRYYSMSTLNHYDSHIDDAPRAECAARDIQRRDVDGGYRAIRAACESGWDFSSRWRLLSYLDGDAEGTDASRSSRSNTFLGDEQQRLQGQGRVLNIREEQHQQGLQQGSRSQHQHQGLQQGRPRSSSSALQTPFVFPTDLQAILHRVELFLGTYSRTKEEQRHYQQQAAKRRAACRRFLVEPTSRRFKDFHFGLRKFQRLSLSYASELWPVWGGLDLPGASATSAPTSTTSLRKSKNSSSSSEKEGDGSRSSPSFALCWNAILHPFHALDSAGPAGRKSTSALHMIVTSNYQEEIPQSGNEAVERDQWDAPNIWPPLQHIASRSLAFLRDLEVALMSSKSKKSNLLHSISDPMKDFRSCVEHVWQQGAIEETTGQHIFEKYQCSSSSILDGFEGEGEGQQGLSGGSGGEYDVQVGFGWTNGVVLYQQGR
ncbi:unnamed protein product [Amoebophrya sp. A25]|nr:unnamed protein product [Amoebophrya sp. A25]|eukprot:GSA25T00027291001.1